MEYLADDTNIEEISYRKLEDKKTRNVIESEVKKGKIFRVKYRIA